MQGGSVAAKDGLLYTKYKTGKQPNEQAAYYLPTPEISKSRMAARVDGQTRTL